MDLNKCGKSGNYNTFSSYNSNTSNTFKNSNKNHLHSIDGCKFLRETMSNTQRSLNKEKNLKKLARENERQPVIAQKVNLKPFRIQDKPTPLTSKTPRNLKPTSHDITIE